VSSAVTSVDSLEFGTFVRLTGIRSTATATRDPEGHLELDSSFAMSHVHVHNLDVSYNDGTFVVGDSKLPIKVPVQTVLSALKASGITAKFLPETRSKTGVTSGGLMLTFKLPGAPQGLIPPIPLPLPIGVGLPTTPTQVTYVLGRTEVASTFQAIPGDDGGGLIGGTTGGTTPPASGTTGGATTGGTAPPISGGTSSGLPPVGGSGGGPQVAPPSGTTAPPASAAALTGAAVTSNHSADIYLAVVLTALAIFGSASAIRFLGVRLSWTS
jgi:hypothetical protein